MKVTKRQLKRLIEASIEFTPDELKKIKDEEAAVVDDIAKDSNLSPEAVKYAIIDIQDDDQQKEALEKLPIYKKHSYGLDDIPDAGKAEDDIIGHT